MLFNVYYHSQENGEYLRHVVDSSGIAQIKHFQNLTGLNGEIGVDAVLVEYQDNNSHLDNWIAQTSSRTDCPEIILFTPEASPALIWKTLKLGVRELFSGTIPPEGFQEAIVRMVMRSTGGGPIQTIEACQRCYPWEPGQPEERAAG
jgi:hypothetical protein